MRIHQKGCNTRQEARVVADIYSAHDAGFVCFRKTAEVESAGCPRWVLQMTIDSERRGAREVGLRAAE